MMRVLKGLGKTRPTAINGSVDIKLKPVEIQTVMFILEKKKPVYVT
jgi:hypothetical protein